MRAAATSASSLLASTGELGAWGMPCPAMKARACVLWPSARIQRGDGPMKHRPCCCTASAKPAFSDRKP